MNRVIVSGGHIISARHTQLVALDQDGRCNIIVRWDSNTEKKYYWENLRLGTMSSPRIYDIVVIKPEPILLGDTPKAPKYYPDFLVQDARKAWYFVEVKGAVETPTWRKVMAILADRIESGRLTASFLGESVHPTLKIVRYINKQWEIEEIKKSSDAHGRAAVKK